jgi:predicted Zn-dependent protease
MGEISMMLKKERGGLLHGIAGGLMAAATAVALISCQTNSYTGRSQMILIGDSQAASMGVSAFDQIKKEKKTTNDPKYTGPVGAVVSRLTEANHLGGQTWETRVFVDDTPNAFALPGGKIGVHTGLFKVAKNDAQLAAVLGHEIGHVLSRHSAERVSQGLVAQVGTTAVGASYGDAAANLFAQAATLGVILPYSRTQESEADDIGLTLMARAGYDPRQAIPLWENFKKEGGSRPPEFLSTHPAPETRIQRLNAHMAKAVAEYERSPYKGR